MINSSQTFPHQTVGLDVGDRTCRLTALDAAGQVTDQRTLKLTRGALGKYFKKCRGARVAFEIGTPAHWIADVLEGCGCEVVVANARQLHLITKSLRKTDANDSELLARLARSDIELLRPIRLRGPQTVRDRALLVGRDNLVACRKKLVNSIRSISKQFGERLPSCGARYFARRAKDNLPARIEEIVRPMLSAIEKLDTEIDEYDRCIAKAAERYPETGLLRQVQGVGVLTAMAFVLAIEDPTRFQRSRDVGAYLGLTPRLHESGNTKLQLGITKAGDRYTRRLLVGSAQYILGRFGADSDLRRHGLAIAERGGKSGKKKATVAVARKLAVLLYTLWVNQAAYVPLRNTTNKSRRAAG